MAEGIIKKLTAAERSYYTAAEVRVLMGVSRDTAYRMIRSLRSDLIADGKLAKGYPTGKIPKKVFNQMYMID
ncbi:ICEBs1 excisionase [Parablautia sp. Marseille-Q6255]|uniref:ICEBs1 excisionase n=1 Tax=Parablautia sp. Marseille-Q6255 TaxID=3039593 RepID=UPI0024BD5174|nr:ICEBs1 excisionase [Parablautia sp. Marseille-Q6255]